MSTSALRDWLEGHCREGQVKSMAQAFFGPQSIWGPALPEEYPGLDQPFDPDAGREFAYKLLMQLESRVATQRLGFRSGDCQSALNSVHALFELARELTAAHGVVARGVAGVVWWMFNRDVRPFTARWHRASQKGSLQYHDVQRRFRGELEHLQAALLAWVGFLRVTLDGGVLESHPVVRPRPVRRFAKSPATRDGFAVPTAYANAFAAQVDAEMRRLPAWRERTNRSALGEDESVVTGIAISGGGIRSATFALGVLRQLAVSIDVFAVDYLSTVSGGGYVGSLVTSAYHHRLYDERRIARGPLADASGGADLARATIGWLRGQSNVMRYDLEMISDLAGKVVQVGADAAATVYRERLEHIWLIRPDADPEAAEFGLVVTGGGDAQLAELGDVGPLQIWNLSVNATQMPPRMHAALRGRGADMYTLSRAGAECRLLGHAPTPRGWNLGSAMALSGAACAPNTGETSGDWTVRLAGSIANLGGWVEHFNGDTKQPGAWKRIKALFGSTQVSDNVAFLSDGGHVENTGAYALLRRRCGLVLLIDGEQDAEMSFAGLVELQHLARVELGVHLDVDTTDLELDDSGLSSAHCVCIPMTYPRLDEDTPEAAGLLLYVKLSLTGDEPRYVQSFRATNPAFPHHSTVRHQGYDDKTFEAYLALGEHIGRELIEWGGEHVSFEGWMHAVCSRMLDT